MPECRRCGDVVEYVAVRQSDDGDLLRWCEPCYGRLFHTVADAPGEWVGWDSEVGA